MDLKRTANFMSQLMVPLCCCYQSAGKQEAAVNISSNSEMQRIKQAQQ
jgi:hypothetical protein